MVTRAIVVAGLSAVAIAAAGCSGDSDPEADFRAAFEKKFSAAPWYHHITGMEVTDRDITGMEVTDGSGRPHIEVTTDLRPGDGQPDRGFCGVIRGFAFDSGAYDETPIVTVIGADGVERGGCG